MKGEKSAGTKRSSIVSKRSSIQEEPAKGGKVGEGDGGGGADVLGKEQNDEEEKESDEASKEVSQIRTRETVIDMPDESVLRKISDIILEDEEESLGDSLGATVRNTV